MPPASEMTHSLAKAEAQPRQGRHRCSNSRKQSPSSVRSGIVRPATQSPLLQFSLWRKRRVDAAPVGVLNVRVCIGYKEAAPPALPLDRGGWSDPKERAAGPWRGRGGPGPQRGTSAGPALPRRSLERPKYLALARAGVSASRE